MTCVLQGPPKSITRAWDSRKAWQDTIERDELTTIAPHFVRDVPEQSSRSSTGSILKLRGRLEAPVEASRGPLGGWGPSASADDGTSPCGCRCSLLDARSSCCYCVCCVLRLLLNSSRLGIPERSVGTDGVERIQWSRGARQKCSSRHTDASQTRGHGPVSSAAADRGREVEWLECRGQSDLVL